MTKPMITEALRKNYDAFINYISSLSAEDFLFHYGQKWTAGQQAAHLLIGIKALVRVFGMSTIEIAQHFGTAKGISRSSKEITTLYLKKLSEGGKAPERSLPEVIEIEQKTLLLENLTTVIHDLCSKINNFTEEELDRLYIPHPLLGNVTMREMLFNAIHHVSHHHQLTKYYLSLPTDKA